MIYFRVLGGVVLQLRLQDRLVYPELNAIALNGATVHVEPKAIQVLLELAKHPGEVVPQKQIIQSVWGGVFVCDEVVTNAISLLRRALKDNAKHSLFIQTIPKRGYRLVVRPVQESATEDCSTVNALPEPRTGYSQPTGIPANAEASIKIVDLGRSLLRVRYLRHEETIASLNSARAYCEEIIRQEPNCAAAHAELALAVFQLQKIDGISRVEAEPLVRNAVDRALCLDEHAAVALACRAKQEYRYDWKWNRAEHYFQQALAADPFDADVCTEFSIMLAVTRRFEESLAWSQRGCRLEPLSPAAHLQAAHASYCAGQRETAVIEYQRVLRCTPGHAFARWGLADVLTRSGQPRQAISVLAEGLRLAGSENRPILLMALSHTKAVLRGSMEERLKSDEPQQQQTRDPVMLAELCCSLGNTTKALQFLSQAAEMKHYRLSAVNMFPQYEPLREDPRGKRLLTRIGLGL